MVHRCRLNVCFGGLKQRRLTTHPTSELTPERTSEALAYMSAHALEVYNATAATCWFGPGRPGFEESPLSQLKLNAIVCFCKVFPQL